jgi:hypothetical protein
MGRSVETIGGLLNRILPVVACVLLILQACGPSAETSRREGALENEEKLRSYEAGFDPTQYNPDVKAILEQELKKSSGTKETSVEPTTNESPEIVPGFRVQIFASTSIDEATKEKERAEELFSEERFYVIYDPPTYKIRGGDFVTRFEADRFLKQVIQSGFRDAWIVPDRIYKNPPPLREDSGNRK